MHQFHLSSLSTYSLKSGELLKPDVWNRTHFRTDQAPISIGSALLEKVGSDIQLRLETPLYATVGNSFHVLLWNSIGIYGWSEVTGKHHVASQTVTILSIPVGLTVGETVSVAFHTTLPLAILPGANSTVSGTSLLVSGVNADVRSKLLANSEALAVLPISGLDTSVLDSRWRYGNSASEPTPGTIEISLTGAFDAGDINPVFSLVFKVDQRYTRNESASICGTQGGRMLYNVSIQYISLPKNVPSISNDFVRLQDTPFFWVFVLFPGCSSTRSLASYDTLNSHATLPIWARSNSTAVFRISSSTFRMTGDSAFAYLYGSHSVQCSISGSLLTPDIIITDSLMNPLDTRHTPLSLSRVPQSNTISIGLEVAVHT